MFTTIKRNTVSLGEQKLYEKVYYLKTLITDENIIENRFLIIPAFRDFQQVALISELTDSMARRMCFEIASNLYYTFVVKSNKMEDSKLNLFITAIVTSCGEEIYSYTEEFIRTYIDNEDGQVHNIIKSAKAYIAEHLSEDISVAELASRFYVTPNYFSRLFKKVEGEGCNEYIVRLRIEKAISLLETTSYKTGKIASMVGYHDNNYFSLSFKKRTGVSPTKYREAIRHQIS